MRRGNELSPNQSLQLILCTFEVCPRTDRRGVNLISDGLPFGQLSYTQVSHAIGYAEFYSRSHDAVIRVYDKAGNVIQTPEQVGEFREQKRC
jgi:hypothetical protein